MDTIRHARIEDARALAELINIAGEGLAMYLWSQSATENQSPLDFGTSKAENATGGSSYRNVSGSEPLRKLNLPLRLHHRFPGQPQIFDH